MVFIVHFHYVRYYLLGFHVLVFVLHTFFTSFRNLLVTDLSLRIPLSLIPLWGVIWANLLGIIYTCGRIYYISR